MGDADKPNKVQALADALYAQRDEGSQSPKRRPSVIPPPNDRRSMPHRERQRSGGQDRGRVSLLPENERPYNSNASMRPQNGAYTTEVKRPVLLDEEEGSPYPQTPAYSAIPPAAPRFSQYGTEVRKSLLPDDQAALRPVARQWSAPGDTLEPEWNPAPRRDLSLSMPPAPSKVPSAPPRDRSSGPPSFGNPSTSERKSLKPLETLKSLIPGRNQQTEWQEDPRYLSAMESRSRGRKIEALLQLEQLLMAEPAHDPARREVFAIAVEMRLEPRVQEHVDWVLQDIARGQDHARVCAAYRSVRTTFPNVVFGERTLIAAIVAGDKTQDGRVVVDVTKLLLKSFPNSGVLPRAFMSSAQVQINEGRVDLARTTLQNLIARFPHDSLAVHARKKLGELG